MKTTQFSHKLTSMKIFLFLRKRVTEKANFDLGIKILQDLTPSTKKHLKPFFNSYQYFWSFNYFKDCNNLIPFFDFDHTKKTKY